MSAEPGVTGAIRRAAEMKSRELANLRLGMKETEDTLAEQREWRATIERDLGDLCDWLDKNVPATHPLQPTWRERLMPEVPA